MAQGDLSLMNDPIAQELLHSKIPARLAYNWLDGTPRVVPIWFHWDGAQFVFGTPPRAPKLKALAKNRKVALTIDSNDFPHGVLLVRGSVAEITLMDGIVPEYAAAAKRYFGEADGAAWVANVASMLTQMARIAMTPEWAGILDFRERFPSALSA